MARKKVHKNQQEIVSLENSGTSYLDIFTQTPRLSISLMVGLAILAVYLPSILSSTLIINDESVLRLPLLSQAKNISLIFSRDFMLFTEGQYRPLSYAILSLFRTVISANTILFWHFLLLFFHAVNALLVFVLIRQFTTRVSTALVGTLIFSLQPLCTVVVNDINQINILTGTTFCLSTIVFYVIFKIQKQPFFYFLSFGCFFLSLFTTRQGYSAAIIILLFELLYSRTDIRKLWITFTPYLLLILFLLPQLFSVTPHPLHYKYVQMHDSSLWHGFYTFIGATGTYLQGILLTLAFPTKGFPLISAFPTVLHESIQQIFQPLDYRFAVWMAFHIFIVSGMIWGLFRKKWFCIGLLITYCSMIPYCSVYINRVVGYISWSYFYFAMAGLALFTAGLFDLSFHIQNSFEKRSVKIFVLAILLFWGGRACMLNQAAADPFTYWWRVAEQSGSSITSLKELAKCLFCQR